MTATHTIYEDGTHWQRKDGRWDAGGDDARAR